MTDRQQSLDILNATHTFPSPVMFKVIGENNETFVARVVAAVRDELVAVEDPPYTTREARNGRHISITLEPQMSDAEQVLAVYDRLRTLPGVLMLM